MNMVEDLITQEDIDKATYVQIQIGKTIMLASKDWAEQHIGCTVELAEPHPQQDAQTDTSEDESDTTQQVDDTTSQTHTGSQTIDLR